MTRHRVTMLPGTLSSRKGLPVSQFDNIHIGYVSAIGAGLALVLKAFGAYIIKAFSIGRGSAEAGASVAFLKQYPTRVDVEEIVRREMAVLNAAVTRIETATMDSAKCLAVLVSNSNRALDMLDDRR